MTLKEVKRYEHQSTVNKVVFCPKNKWLAAGDENGSIVLRDPIKGTEEKRIESYKSPILRLIFTPDAKQIVGLFNEIGGGPIKIWEIESGMEIFSKPSTGIFEILPDGSAFVSYADGKAQIRDASTLESKREIRILPKSVGIDRVALSADGKMIANGFSIDKTISIWAVASGERIAILKGHKAILRELCFSRSGKWVGAVGGDNAVRLWKTQTGDLVHCIEPDGRPISLAISPDEKWLAVGFAVTKKSNLVIYDALSGKEALAKTLTSGAVRDMAFDSTGKMLACTAGKSVQVFELGIEKNPQK